tara:strand:- start:173 stop:469 length:297 start_codon:yes stop_codon:yes gene_type:complete
MKFKIYLPAKSSMQSGLQNTSRWCLEPVDVSNKIHSSNYGWLSSDNPFEQIKLFFDSKKQAVDFAIKKGWDFSVYEENKRNVVKKNYADNFKPKKKRF